MRFQPTPFPTLLALLVLLLPLAACDEVEVVEPIPDNPPGELAEGLEEVASFPETQITGVAVSEDGRLFVNAPYWPGQASTRVMEVMGDGSTQLYPSEAWHGWNEDGDLSPEDHFVCVQSVWADDAGRLWILDPASPNLAGVVAGGAKLVAVDLETDEVVETYRFGPEIARPGSYLNDVRVDTDLGVAYLTDSGDGALVVLDLESGEARRVLDEHPSTHADPALVPVVGGEELRDAQGKVPRIHADGLALDEDGDLLYYHALTATHLFRIDTEALRDPELTEEELGDRVEDLGETVVTDGMWIDGYGRVYHTALTQNALLRWVPGLELEVVVRDERLSWPDSLAPGPDGGELYVTTSQIHLSPLLGHEEGPAEPYKVWKVRVPE